MPCDDTADEARDVGFVADVGHHELDVSALGAEGCGDLCADVLPAPGQDDGVPQPAERLSCGQTDAGQRAGDQNDAPHACHPSDDTRVRSARQHRDALDVVGERKRVEDPQFLHPVTVP